MWYFLNLRKLAIAGLDRMAVLTNVDKITLGRRYSVSSWVLAGLRGLVQKDDTITDDEITEISYATAVKLFRIRELKLKALVAQSSGYGYPSGPPWTQKVEEVFSTEIASLRADEEAFKVPDAEEKAVPVPKKKSHRK